MAPEWPLRWRAPTAAALTLREETWHSHNLCRVECPCRRCFWCSGRGRGTRGLCYGESPHCHCSQCSGKDVVSCGLCCGECLRHCCSPCSGRGCGTCVALAMLSPHAATVVSAQEGHVALMAFAVVSTHTIAVLCAGGRRGTCVALAVVSPHTAAIVSAQGGAVALMWPSLW